ncbi:TraM recognition domain-containing protein [Bacteriovorax sp. PP10]|uniref:TraM recognition domain-containing protein n=1 Tax=Bacteriovorax antarcticus TaxID=3088717 RepID=A0ABU5VZH9_9BACT|nr:TraM recognition domain-containing protein [Bacteriovorax sp. PP10]MEA9358446.1 TraM recognition domain-containing protein [Bacteriovorax sp. PP10]
MSSASKRADGLDLVSPLVEVIHELFGQFFKLLGELLKIAYRRITKEEGELKKIERSHLKNKKQSKKQIEIGYSSNQKKCLKLSDIDFGKHNFIVGAAGFGKTNLISILQEHSLEQGKPVIFFDPKGDLEALLTFKKLCEIYKRKCYIFSEHYSDVVKLNPVKEGSINQVVDRIMCAFDWSEQFYKDIAQKTLRDILFELQAKKTPYSLRNILEQLQDNHKSDKTLGLEMKLQTFVDSDFGKLLEEDEDTLTFSKVRKEKSCLYIGLSTQGYGETAMALGKIFLGELLYNSYWQLTQSANSHESIKNSISVFFDEFGAIVTPRFIELQNKCRGAGIQLYMAVQSSSDIDRVDPELTLQIIENASNLFILKQRLDSAASLFSSAIGTIITKKHTHVMEDGETQSKGSEREGNENLVHPDIIKNLRVGQCILLRHSPTKIDLLNIRNRKIEIDEGKASTQTAPLEIKQSKVNLRRGRA